MERAFRLCPVSYEMFRALTFREILAAERAALLREFNKCHNPEGDGGGRFCSHRGERKALGRPGSAKLPDEPGRYFKRDAKTVMVPLDQMNTIRAREKGIRNAEHHMRRAYRGEGGRRKPISLRKLPDGRYEVLDGNSTTAIARKHGWKSLPAHVE